MMDSGTQKLLGMCLELVQEIEDAPDNENPLYLVKLPDLLSEAIELLGTSISTVARSAFHQRGGVQQAGRTRVVRLSINGVVLLPS